MCQDLSSGDEDLASSRRQFYSGDKEESQQQDMLEFQLDVAGRWSSEGSGNQESCGSESSMRLLISPDVVREKADEFGSKACSEDLVHHAKHRGSSSSDGSA